MLLKMLNHWAETGEWEEFHDYLLELGLDRCAAHARMCRYQPERHNCCLNTLAEHVTAGEAPFWLASADEQMVSLFNLIVDEQSHLARQAVGI